MKNLRIRLDIHSGTLTPFQADTIFGHLCWVVAYRGTDKDLQQFLEPFKNGSPPFTISDGFPAGFLPKPLSTEFNIDDPAGRKELKALDFLAVEDFNRVRKGASFKPQHIEVPLSTTTVTHNTVSRLTQTTPPEGGVYSIEETFTPCVDVYVKVISEAWISRVAELFEELSKTGYGRRKSIGKGQFSVSGITEWQFERIEGANGFVTLSNFCPRSEDPTQGLYKTFVKYGKLGGHFTFCGNAFKRPLVMIRTGSVFNTGGDPKEFYGRMVQEHIAPAKPEVVQYAYAFTVPLVFRQEGMPAAASQRSDNLA